MFDDDGVLLKMINDLTASEEHADLKSHQIEYESVVMSSPDNTMGLVFKHRVGISALPNIVITRKNENSETESDPETVSIHSEDETTIAAIEIDNEPRIDEEREYKQHLMKYMSIKDRIDIDIVKAFNYFWILTLESAISVFDLLEKMKSLRFPVPPIYTICDNLRRGLRYGRYVCCYRPDDNPDKPPIEVRPPTDNEELLSAKPTYKFAICANMLCIDYLSNSHFQVFCPHLKVPPTGVLKFYTMLTNTEDLFRKRNRRRLDRG